MLGKERRNTEARSHRVKEKSAVTEWRGRSSRATEWTDGIYGIVCAWRYLASGLELQFAVGLVSVGFRHCNVR